jgi:hypothetical protein
MQLQQRKNILLSLLVHLRGERRRPEWTGQGPAEADATFFHGFRDGCGNISGWALARVFHTSSSS